MKVFAISSPKIQNIANKKEFMIWRILPVLMVAEKSSFDSTICDFNHIIVVWASWNILKYSSYWCSPFWIRQAIVSANYRCCYEKPKLDARLQPTIINLTLSCSQNNLKRHNTISIVWWCLNLFNLDYTISTNRKDFCENMTLVH